MSFLAIIFGIVGVICLYGVYDDYKTKKKELEANGKKIEMQTFFTKGYKKATVIGITCIVIALFVGSLIPSEEPSKWDKLTDEEKQWYEDNYGNGQFDTYKKAIEDYKKSK